MYALGPKRLDYLFARCDGSIIRVVDYYLAALDGEKVPDLVFESSLDLLS